MESRQKTIVWLRPTQTAKALKKNLVLLAQPVASTATMMLRLAGQQHERGVVFETNSAESTVSSIAQPDQSVSWSADSQMSV